jgi:uncharacterized protein (DUF1697 family)
MTPYVALLRAVNVGGTGKLAMSDLKMLCEQAGFQSVQTYIASGNVVFQSTKREAAVKAALESRLHTHTGKSIGVLIRTGAEMAEVLARNPFPDAPGNRVMAIFLDAPGTLDGVTGQAPGEHIQLGQREIYVHYGSGMATTRLRIPAAAAGTARNMNTVARLADMAKD